MLYFQFKDKTAVNDVNLTLTPGIWGLLGANGAGKTTIMRMIADIMTPTNGAVYYDGKDIRELGEVYRSKFGFLPPDRLEIFFFFTSESERMSNK